MCCGLADSIGSFGLSELLLFVYSHIDQSSSGACTKNEHDLEMGLYS